MSTPTEIRVAIVTRAALGTREGLQRMLTTLASAGVTPTHAGIDENPTAAYDRDAFIEVVLEDGREVTMPSFVRRKAPRYEGYFTARHRGMSFVKLDFSPVDDGEAPYRAGDALAEELQAEFGYVHPIITGAGGDWNGVANVTVDELQRYGPYGITARMYLGAHMVGLFGAERLDGAGGEQRPRRGGGRVVDLAPSPWTASLEVLEARRRALAAHLAPAGVIGDHDEDKAAGPGWKPIPLV
jgi:hypothetical protein